jgi:ribosomal protein S18 acetylase RimI-like enzyme
VIVDLVPSHSDGCRAVIASLPEWFGYEGALESTARAAATERGFVALNGQQVVGFVTTTPQFEETLEITYLAIDARWRGRGIGSRLVTAVGSLAESMGATSIVLLTLGPSAESPHYAETIAFYRSIGFSRTKELHPHEWGDAPALVMTAMVSVIGGRAGL